MSIIAGLSIRKRIVLYIFLFLVLFASIAAISQYFLTQGNKSEVLLKNALETKSLVQELKIYENQFLTEDVLSDLFYETRSSKNIDNFYAVYQEALMLLNESFNKENQSLIDSTIVNELFHRLNQYKSSVDTLVEKTLQKGFKDYGIIGEFRTSVHQSEDLVIASGNERFYNYILKMRRHEKDFLLRQDEKYVDQFRNTYYEFIAELENNADESYVDDLKAVTDNYVNRFYQLVELQNEIGTHEKGLLKRVYTNSQVIMPHLSNIVTLTENHRDRMLLNMRVSLVVLLALTAILVIALLTRLIAVIRKPIKALEERIVQLGSGDVSKQLVEIKGSNEIARMGNALNSLINGLRNTVAFANDISQGKYDTDFKPLSDKDTLGKSLLDMRENLVKASEEAENQRKAEHQQNWINSGTAKFADILNQNYSDTGEFAFNIISNLVKYLNANQGGMFLVNDDNPEDVHLELKSAFAYNRRKFLEKRVELGEGFVGTSVLEKNIIYRTEIPDDYITITSGLGDANPNVLLIIPLVLEDKYYGVIEIASFNEFKEYEMEFISKISETIASTISAVKSKERTEKLLEKTREQAEQITQTEEEMRQNMEELQATQEEMARKQNELEARKTLMENLLDTIPLPVFVKDENKKYFLVNNEESKLFNLSKDKIIGYTESELVQDEISVQIADESDAKVFAENKRIELPEQRVKLNNGAEKVLKTIKIPFTNNITNKINLLGISLEIGNGKCEEELRNANTKIEELTQQLNNLANPA